jgi:hypothetical protein
VNKSKVDCCHLRKKKYVREEAVSDNQVSVELFHKSHQLRRGVGLGYSDGRSVIVEAGGLDETSALLPSEKAKEKKGRAE